MLRAAPFLCSGLVGFCQGWLNHGLNYLSATLEFGVNTRLYSCFVFVLICLQSFCNSVAVLLMNLVNFAFEMLQFGANFAY